MDEHGGYKRRKRSKKNKEKLSKDRDSNSPRKVSANKLIQSVNKTQRLYEKHSSNQNITQKRMTIRPGIFNRGKCTSFVHRAVNLSPEKKARMDADLHRIIQLANDRPLNRHSSPSLSENLKKRADESITHCKPLVKREKTIRCEGNKNADSPLLDGNMESIENESNPSLPRNGRDSSGCERGKKKEICLSRTAFHKSLQNISSSSSSSNSSYDSANVMQSELINHSDPPLEIYEEFADSVVSAIRSKLKSLFPCRDYLQEARSAIKRKCNLSQIHFKIYEEQLGPTQRERTRGNEDSRELWLREKNVPLPMMIDQAVGTSARFPPVHLQVTTSREYSPVRVSLSPRTTILNPIEYLKRVEKQVDRNSNDRWHETNVSQDSSLSGSQRKSCLNDNWNLINGPFDINNTNIHPSGIATQKMIYKHSNRCYIDSPQAVEFKEARFFAQTQQQSQFTNHLSGLVINRHGMSKRPISDIQVDSKNLGFEYLMNASALPEASGKYDCCDLLDDLDAADCNIITKGICVSSSEGKPEMNKALVVESW